MPHSRLARVVVAAAAVAALASLLTAGPARAQAPAGEGKAIVVGGLRPSADSSYDSTDIKRLPEAQRLREIIDDAVKEITQRSIVNHAGLRAALGSSYLVEFFDCKGAVKCVTRLFTKLRSQATLVVYGDYAVKRKNSLVRLRLVELASGKLLAEQEFSIKGGQLEDKEQWVRELRLLLASITPATSGGGETGGGETGGGETGGGEAGGGETGGSQSGGGETGGTEGSGHQTDELTDADFGEVASADLSVVRVQERTDGFALEVAAGVTTWQRRFDFISAEGFERLRPPSFRSGWGTKFGGAVEAYPLARRRGGFLSGFGVLGEFSRSVTLGDSSRASDQRLLAGAVYRIPIGSSDTLPTIKLVAAYLREDVKVVDSPVELPDVAYRATVVGGDVRLPLFTRRLALIGGARYLLVSSAGDILAPGTFGSARSGGLDFAGTLSLQPIDNLLIRLGGSYSRIVLEFDGNGAMSSSGAIGARDRYFGATLAVGLVL